MYAAMMTHAEPSPARLWPAWITHSTNWIYFGLLAGNQIASFLPGQQLLETFGRIAGAERAIDMNQKWAESCREWIAKGVPSPLNDALQQVDKWTLERDSARARLKDLGYRARFRGVIGGTDDRGITP
jgi:hypothetical protein